MPYNHGPNQDFTARCYVTCHLLNGGTKYFEERKRGNDQKHLKLNEDYLDIYGSAGHAEHFALAILRRIIKRNEVIRIDFEINMNPCSNCQQDLNQFKRNNPKIEFNLRIER